MKDSGSLDGTAKDCFTGELIRNRDLVISGQSSAADSPIKQSLTRLAKEPTWFWGLLCGVWWGGWTSKPQAISN